MIGSVAPKAFIVTSDVPYVGEFTPPGVSETLPKWCLSGGLHGQSRITPDDSVGSSLASLIAPDEAAILGRDCIVVEIAAS